MSTAGTGGHQRLRLDEVRQNLTLLPHLLSPSIVPALLSLFFSSRNTFKPTNDLTQLHHSIELTEMQWLYCLPARRARSITTLPQCRQKYNNHKFHFQTMCMTICLICKTYLQISEFDHNDFNYVKTQWRKGRKLNTAMQTVFITVMWQFHTM